MYKQTIKFLRKHNPSDRKLRLFAIACCRHIDIEIPLLLDALDVAEKYIEGKVSVGEVKLEQSKISKTLKSGDHNDFFAVYYALDVSASRYKGPASAAYFADRSVFKGRWSSESPEWAWQKKVMKHMFR